MPSAQEQLQAATVRVAIAAYLHDLGKLAERAGVFDGDPRLDAHLTLYCPFHREGGWYSHRHAAHTALAIEALEAQLPDLVKGDCAPFASRRRAGDLVDDATDSLINAAAAHHKPATFLQWIIATADRVASGFEREEFDRYNEGADKTAAGRNHYQARLLTLFEQIGRDTTRPGDLKQRYPLRTLSPATIFPAPAADCEPTADTPAREEYRALWDALVDGLARIPATHRANLALWLDHFDALWLSVAHAIPSATAFNVKPEVSLYDHSRTTAALAAALWRWHVDAGRTDAEAAAALQARRGDFDEPKFLLVQGDFAGIQDFIFSAAGEQAKHAARLLRGRSFQVSLFTELAALRVLDALALPSTAQVINAAGKFLIVAPNTADTRAALQSLADEFDGWFRDQTFGIASLSLAWETASCNDLVRHPKEGATPFKRLTDRLRDSLDRAKHRRFDLCASGAHVFTREYPHGPCALHGQLPADAVDRDGTPTCALSRDQRAVGEAIVKSGFDRLLVVRDSAADQLRASNWLPVLELPVLGYRVAFTADADVTGAFGALAASGDLRRCWDFSDARADAVTPLFSGYGRRFISGHVPRADAFNAHDPRLEGLAKEDCPTQGIATFDMLARANLGFDNKTESLHGIPALGVIKGDIDNLGTLFGKSLGDRPSFAKWASLSRQVNAFFAIWLPDLLAREHPHTYTVFAGGDDFFLIGPARDAQRLLAKLRDEFARYVAGNPDIHFSAGLATHKPGAPLRSFAEQAEEALDAAKAADLRRSDGRRKNAVTCYGQTIGWERWPEIEAVIADLDRIRADLGFSTAYLYALLQFVDMRENEDHNVADSIWRARLAYRTRRFIEAGLRGKNLDRDARDRELRAGQALLMDAIAVRGIDELGSAYRIALFNHLYQYRQR